MPARIMFIGEAPGREEVIERKPFVGAAGRLLKQILHSVGINPAQCYFTNICKYQPPRNKLSAFFDQKTGFPGPEILEGLAELREEIEACKPNVICLLGANPLWALTSDCAKWNHSRDQQTGYAMGWSGITDWRGSIIPANALGGERKCVATYHPAAILRKWDWGEYLRLDLARVREQSSFPEIRRPQRQLLINPQGADRLAFRERLLASSSEFISADIEHLPGPRFIGASFCADSGEAGFIATKTSSDIAFVRSIFESGKPLAFQNGMFDCATLEYWYNIRAFENFKYDTMLASHAAYLELPKDLGTLCSIYTEQPCYWTKINWEAIKRGKQSIEVVYDYGGIDAWVTHEVRLAQEADELTNPAVRHWYEHELALVRPLWKMDRKGILVDKVGLAKLRSDLEANIARLSELTGFAAGKDINVMSGPQLKAYLIDDLGLKAAKKTKGGRVSLDDKALAAMSLAAKNDQQRTAIRLVREERRDRSLISKFCNITFGSDSRFRCTHNPGGTNTGRLSSHAFDPTGEGDNGQNIPKRVRYLYKPDRGKVLGYSDYERAESWVVAKITGDPLMLAHHAPGADAHKLLATEIFEKPVEEIDKAEREIGKQTRHAGNYMQGATTFMTNVNKREWETGVSITLQEAKFLIQRYRELHVCLEPWWQSVKKQAYQNGNVLYNLLGRPRKFYDHPERDLPEKVAYVPQSTVGDSMNIALLRADADEELADYHFELLLQVHDALGWQCDNGYEGKTIERLDQLMLVDLTNPRTGELFTIPVEHAIGENWGEVKRWQPTTA
jgi:uracil-DNA glycosylase family 4